MNTLRILLILSFLLVVVVAFQTGFLQKSQTPAKNITDSDVLQEKTGVIDVSPTSAPPTQSSPASRMQENSTDFTYPASSLSAEEADSTTYTTTDSPDIVTAWYKNKINANGYKTKTFINTKTNGQIKNVLSGSKDNNEIKITISKNVDDMLTIITISPKNP